MVKIGVFDSGIGGQSVAARLQELFPTAEVIFVSDHSNVPYGTKSPDEIRSLTDAAIQPLLADKCDAIVIACNTATTNAIDYLRASYPAMHFVGLEPMVKPAAAITKTKTIGVLATPMTLASDKYHRLKQQWAAGVTVIEPDCSDWATLIEEGHGDTIAVDSVVEDLKSQHVDVIVLGCTHYHWIKDRIQAVAGDTIAVLEPSDAIRARLDSLLSISSELPG